LVALFVVSLLDVGEIFRVLDSSEHFESVLQVSDLVSHFAVHDPVDAEIFDEDGADFPENFLESNDLARVSRSCENEVAEALDSADGSLGLADEIDKLLESDAFGLKEGFKVLNGKLRNSKRSNRLSVVDDQVLGTAWFSGSLLLNLFFRGAWLGLNSVGGKEKILARALQEVDRLCQLLVDLVQASLSS